jgi:hypothetical protein
MHGLLKKMNSKNNMDSYTKPMNQCTIELFNINKGKVFFYKLFREKAYNKTVEHLSYTYHKTLDLNKTHPWLGEML